MRSYATYRSVYYILAEIPGVARDSITNIHVLFLIQTVT
jgi:hypothetical protein